MTFTKLRCSYGCNSVKGVGCVSKTEYVVYNWAQASIPKVKIGTKSISLLAILRGTGSGVITNASIMGRSMSGPANTSVQMAYVCFTGYITWAPAQYKSR